MGIKQTHGRGYFAQVDIALLRIYTRGRRCIDQAIDDQLIISQMREALFSEAEARADIWNDTDEICRIVGDVLAQNGSSEEELGLRMCVQMRAPQSIHRRHVLTSPFMPLAKALPLRARLVSARATSWENYRRQWVKMMCSTRNARYRSLCQRDAEEFVNKARQEFLDERFKVAMSTVEKILAEDNKKSKVPKTYPLKGRFVQAALGIQKKDSSSDCHMWKDRMELFLQRELSTSELSRFCK